MASALKKKICRTHTWISAVAGYVTCRISMIPGKCQQCVIQVSELADAVEYADFQTTKKTVARLLQPFGNIVIGRQLHGTKRKSRMDFSSSKKLITETYFRNTALDLTEWREQFDQDLNRTVVNIPARAGSTRIKDKNIRDICGIPLLAYTIKIAKAIPGVDRVIVNTDNVHYARIAEKHGAEAPFLRPASLASSTSNSYWAYYFLFRHLVDEDYPVKSIITLPPTNPFRNVAHLTKLVEILFRKGGVQTAMAVNVNPDSIAYLSKPGLKRLSPSVPEDGLLFKPLGHFTGQHCLHVHIKGKHIEFLTNPIELVDIDTEEDIAMTQQIIENDLYDFGVVI